MPLKKVPRHLIPLLKGSVDTFVNNPIILLPFLTIAFIQLLILEILYFSPRFPLSVFFNPRHCGGQNLFITQIIS